MGETVKRVAFWNRMSHENSVERESHLNHRARAEEFCRFHGYELVKEYSLLEVSGSKVREHPAYYEYRSDVRAHRIDALLVTWIKRFARKVSILVEEVQFLQEHKVDFIAINDHVDTTTPYGRFFFHIIAALAELEADEVSERIRQSVRPRAERGLALGQAPFGYRWQNRILAVDEEKAAIVRAAFSNFLNLRNLSPTCRILNGMGMHAHRSPFSNTTLRRILTSSVYVGRHLKNYTGSRGGKKFIKGAEHHIVAECPPIIDETTWNMTQAAVGAITVCQPPKARRNHYLLSGLLCCPCGGKFYGVTYRDEKWSKYVCKKCQKRIKLVRADKAVTDLLSQVILRADFLEDRLRSMGVKGYIEKAHNLSNLLQEADAETQSLLIKTLIKKIDVVAERLDVHFRLLPQIDFSGAADRMDIHSDKSLRPNFVQIFPGDQTQVIEFTHSVSIASQAPAETTLAERIRSVRLRRGYLQKDVDSQTGLSPQSCSRFESGRNVPSRDALSRVAAVLGVTPDWLLWGEAGSLAARVMEFRRNIGISQIELGRRVGLPKVINEIERGHNLAPTKKTIQKIASALKVPVEVLCPGGMPSKR